MKKYIVGTVLFSIISLAIYKVSKKNKQSKILVKKDEDFEKGSQPVMEIDRDSLKDTKELIVKMHEQYSNDINENTINELNKQQNRNYDLF